MDVQAPYTWILPFLLLLQSLQHPVTSKVTMPNMTSLGCRERSCYFYSEKPASWEGARDACNMHNDTFLVTVGGDEERTFLHRAASHRGPGLWLGAQQEVFKHWTWLSDHTFHGNLHEFDNMANKAHCGVINIDNKDQLEGSACYETKRFVCAGPDAEHDRTDRFYISPQTRRLTWFEARQDCLSQGMDLASGKGNTTSFLYQLLIDQGGIFWIGLRKSRFIWERDGMELTYTYFKAGEPNYVAELCLEMSQMGEYNDENCQEPLNYVCEWVNTTSQPVIINLEGWDTFLSVSALIIGLTVGGVLLVVLITTVCIVLIVKRIRKAKKKRRTVPAFPGGNLYDSTIEKPQHSNTEVVYDVTNQFHFIKNDPVPLAKQQKKSTEKKPTFRKFSLFSSKTKKKEKEGFDTLESPYENDSQEKKKDKEGFDSFNSVYQNDSQENLYQNAQAALPHYKNLGTNK